MSWDWNSPIALGLFILMCGGAVVLVGLGIGLMTAGSAKVVSARTRDNTTAAATRRR
jgi:hypothetical protein